MKLNIYDSMPTALEGIKAKRKSNPNIPVCPSRTTREGPRMIKRY